MKNRYPLEALVSLREQRVDERAREVADQRQRTDAAQARAEQARRQREAEQARVGEAVTAERDRVEDGGARVADLAAAARFAAQGAAHIEALGQREQELSQELRAEQVEEERRRRALAGADADAKAVAEHRQRWRQERAAQIEAREEDDAADVFGGRRGKR